MTTQVVDDLNHASQHHLTGEPLTKKCEICGHVCSGCRGETVAHMPSIPKQGGR